MTDGSGRWRRPRRVGRYTNFLDTTPSLALNLLVEHHVRQECAHLAVIHLRYHRVERQIDRLHGVDCVSEHALPVGTHVHPRVVHRRPHDGERRPLRTDLVHRAHARRLDDIALLVEACRDDPIAAFSRADRRRARSTCSCAGCGRSDAGTAPEVHLQLVDRVPAPKRPRHEGALRHAVLVPRERHHHARVVVPNAYIARSGVHPERPRPGAHPERAHHRRLGRRHEAGAREVARQPVRARLVIAHHLRLVIQQQRPPLAAHPHRRVDRAPVHLVHPSEPVGVPVVVERPRRLHPRVPRPYVRLHGLQRQHEPKVLQVAPHVLRNPVLLVHDPRHKNLLRTREPDRELSKLVPMPGDDSGLTWYSEDEL